MEQHPKPINGFMQYPHSGLFICDNPNMDLTKNIAANLSGWMDGNPNLDTIKKVAVRSGVGFGTVQRTKNGDGNPTIKNLADIAAAFGKSIEALLADPARQQGATHEAAQPIAAYQVRDALQAELAEINQYEAEAYIAKLDSLKAQIRSIEADIRSAANKARQEKSDRTPEIRASDHHLEDRRTA